MIVKNFEKSKLNIINLLNTEPSIYKRSFSPLVASLLKKRKTYLQIAKMQGTPFYLLDQQILKKNLNDFISAFDHNIPLFKAYYSIKANYCSAIIKTALKHNYGLEVGSEWELQKALFHGAKRVIFNGPGKTIEVLRTAISAEGKVIINIDSLNELQILDGLTRRFKKNIQIGIRIQPNKQKDWVKFGLPLKSLKSTWLIASKLPYVKPAGIHFHSSGSGEVISYSKIIKELSNYLKREFTADMLGSIKFVDFGGGFRPYQSYGYFPWKLPQISILQTANNYFGEETSYKDKYYTPKPISNGKYAQEIGRAIKNNLNFIAQCSYYAEPGKIVASTAMHLITTVVDIKNKTIILDGGVNLVRLGSHMFDYYPAINLTHPSSKEIVVDLYGPLCLQTLDIWNKFCYAKKIKIGDKILMANQGAYTYSLAQNFGSPIAKIYTVE